MKAIMYPAVTLDGFIAKPDGDSYSWVDQKDEMRYDKVVQERGAVIVGRRTYEEYIEDFKSKQDVTIFVCTNRRHSDEGNIRFVNGRPEKILGEVASQGLDEIIICGGGEVNGMFAEAGLVDEIFVSIQPVVLGEGIPLFGSFHPNLKLKLLSTNQDVPGVVQNHYKVVK